MIDTSKNPGQRAIQLDRQYIIWAYRILLDRDPESEAAIDAMQTAWGTTRDLRRGIMASEEFRGKNHGDLAYAPESTVVIAELRNSLRLFVDLSDVAIGLNIARGRYEENELSFVRRAVKPGQTVLDIGANIGFFAIQMGALVGARGHVYAFEPVVRNADLLDRSICENGMQERITLRRVVVGDVEGSGELVELDLEAGALNSGGAYLQRSGARPPSGHEVRSVPMVLLDRERFRGPVSFAKIDIEGAEPLAFRGARVLLERDRPIILSEINPPQLKRVAGCTAGQFLSEMRTLRYDCFVLENGRPSHPINEWSDFSIGSVVFLPAGQPFETPGDPQGISEIDAGGLFRREGTEEERELPATGELREALARARQVEQELRRQIERYAAYHEAVERSGAWRALQFLRSLIGRRW